jgi:hypothetical protein
MSSPPKQNRSIGRQFAGVGMLAVSLLAAAVCLARFVDRVRIPIDFYAFWSAGQVCGTRGNPYDPLQLRPLQQAHGCTADMAIVMWNPPWTLAIVWPFGLLPIAVAYLVWLLIQAVAVFVSAVLLWRAFGGPANRWWIAGIVAFGFTPTLVLLADGQITALALLGVAGFTAAIRANRPGWAGVAASLTALKPHLLAVFGLLLILESLRDRTTRRAVVVGTLMVLAATAVATAVNTAVLGHYADAITAPSSADHRGVSDWCPPTLGWKLRSWIAPERFAVQLIPLAVGSILTVAWWFRRRRFDWITTMPGIVFGSLLIAPYGLWSYDLTLLLVPMLAVAVRISVVRPLVLLAWTLFLAFTVALYAVLASRVPQHALVFFPPLAGISCYILQRLVEARRSSGRVGL